MAFKTFVAGAVLTAAEQNTYLMQQAVIVCTSATRPSSPVEGMTIYETDTDRIMAYNGTAWRFKAGKTPSVRLYHSGTQTLTTATVTAISFAAEEYDTDTLHDNATNPTRITIPTGFDGLWAFGGVIPYAANATGRRASLIRKNGSTVLSQQEAASLDATHFIQQVGGDEARLAAGDYLELCGFQTSGGNLNMDGSVSVNCFFWASYRGDT